VGSFNEVGIPSVIYCCAKDGETKREKVNNTNEQNTNLFIITSFINYFRHLV
jgi:hypothetical protein